MTPCPPSLLPLTPIIIRTDGPVAHGLLPGLPARQRLLLLVQRLPNRPLPPPHRAPPPATLRSGRIHRALHRLPGGTRFVPMELGRMIRYFTEGLP